MADTEKSSHITDHAFEPSDHNSNLCGWIGYYEVHPLERISMARRHEAMCRMAEPAHRETTVERCSNPFCDGKGNIDVSTNASGRSRAYGTCRVGPHE